MNIVYDEEYKSFHLYNEKISYVMKIEKNCYLSHCYFGKRIRRWNEAAKMYYYDRGFCANPDETDRTFSLDTMPGEYPGFGQGDFRSPAMELEFQDGDRNTRFHYAGYQISAGKLSPEKLPHVYVESDKEAMTLEIWMKDEVRGLRLSLYYTIYEDAVLTRFVSIKNESEDIVKIHRLLSMSLDLGEQDYDILTLGGAHTEEKNVYRRHLLGDSIVVESSRGTSSPQATPFLGIMRKETTEEQGEVFGANLIYSGNFWGCVQCGQYGTTRVQLGINPFQFCWNLKPGEQFDTPETVLVYSTEGLGGMSAIFHRLYRKRVCRGKFREKERPVLLNSWEGMYFAISEEKMLELADTAVEAGIELLVMDDGWFRGRNSDTTSLGDWIEDQEKFPEGLQKLAEKVREKGVEFGIWFEPEMVSPESELYKKHPDWVIRSKRYRPIRSRNQLVLDLANPEVREYLIEALSKILKNGNITYVKWDMNRHLTDQELQGGIVGYGISNILFSLLGGLPTATYSQNVGIVATTKVINRCVLGGAALILLIAGVIPKFSSLLTTIPYCVLGGATVSVFASIAMTGMKLITSQNMTFRNTSIVGLAAALGMGISQASDSLASFPDWFVMIFGKSPVVVATLLAVLLNIVLPKDKEDAN